MNVNPFLTTAFTAWKIQQQQKMVELGVVKALFMESFQKKFKWMQSQRFESHQIIRFLWNPITEIWIMHLILNSFNWKQFYVMFDVSVPRNFIYTYSLHSLCFIRFLAYLAQFPQKTTKLLRCVLHFFWIYLSIRSFVHWRVNINAHTHIRTTFI